MNAAQLSSPRLQRTLRVLRAAKRPLSTMQIIAKARVCAVNSIAAELRFHGIPVICQRRGDVWFYRLGELAK